MAWLAAGRARKDFTPPAEVSELLAKNAKLKNKKRKSK